MRWKAAYRADDGNVTDAAFIEAASRAEALGRLRAVVGADTDVLYVLPADETGLDTVFEGTYEDFLNDSDGSTANAPTGA